MNHKLLLAFVAVLSSVSLSAQIRFEAGLGYVPFFLMTVDDGSQFSHKYDVYFEGRYNLRSNSLGRNLDVGAKIDYKVCPESSFDGYATSFKGILHCASILALADFNFSSGKTVNPFIGIGAGPVLAVSHWTSKERNPHVPVIPGEYDFPLGSYTRFAFVVSPRIGVELFQHLRLSLSVDGSLSADVRMPVCLSVGWAF